MIGKRMDPHPADRFRVLPMLKELLDFRRLQLHEAVAALANRHGGHTRLRRARGPRMTVQTGNLILAGVKPVAELDGLLRALRSPLSPNTDAGNANAGK